MNSLETSVEAIPYAVDSTQLIKKQNNTGSTLYDLSNHPDKVLIAHPASTNSNFTPLQILQKNKQAYNLHNKHLPSYTPASELFISDGIYVQNGQAIESPIIVRSTEKMHDVIPLSKLTRKEIMEDPWLLSQLAAVYHGYYNMVKNDQTTPDRGFAGKFGDGLPFGIRQLAAQIATSNIMIGTDKNGNRRVFCDPDWYNLGPQDQSFVHRSRKFLAAVVFKAAAIYFERAAKSSMTNKK